MASERPSNWPGGKAPRPLFSGPVTAVTVASDDVSGICCYAMGSTVFSSDHKRLATVPHGEVITALRVATVECSFCIIIGTSSGLVSLARVRNAGDGEVAAAPLFSAGERIVCLTVDACLVCGGEHVFAATALGTALGLFIPSALLQASASKPESQPSDLSLSERSTAAEPLIVPCAVKLGLSYAADMVVTPAGPAHAPSVLVFSGTYGGDVVVWRPFEASPPEANVTHEPQSCHRQWACGGGAIAGSRISAHQPGCALFAVKVIFLPDAREPLLWRVLVTTCSDDRTATVFSSSPQPRRDWGRSSEYTANGVDCCSWALDTWKLLWRGSGPDFASDRLFDVAICAEEGDFAKDIWVATACEDGAVQLLLLENGYTAVMAAGSEAAPSVSHRVVLRSSAAHDGHGAFRVCYVPHVASCRHHRVPAVLSFGFNGVVKCHFSHASRRTEFPVSGCGSKQDGLVRGVEIDDDGNILVVLRDLLAVHSSGASPLVVPLWPSWLAVSSQNGFGDQLLPHPSPRRSLPTALCGASHCAPWPAEQWANLTPCIGRSVGCELNQRLPMKAIPRTYAAVIGDTSGAVRLLTYSVVEAHGAVSGLHSQPVPSGARHGKVSLIRAVTVEESVLSIALRVDNTLSVVQWFPGHRIGGTDVVHDGPTWVAVPLTERSLVSRASDPMEPWAMSEATCLDIFPVWSSQKPSLELLWVGIGRKRCAMDVFCLTRRGDGRCSDKAVECCHVLSWSADGGSEPLPLGVEPVTRVRGPDDRMKRKKRREESIQAVAVTLLPRKCGSNGAAGPGQGDLASPQGVCITALSGRGNLLPFVLLPSDTAASGWTVAVNTLPRIPTRLPWEMSSLLLADGAVAVTQLGSQVCVHVRYPDGQWHNVGEIDDVRAPRLLCAKVITALNVTRVEVIHCSSGRSVEQWSQCLFWGQKPAGAAAGALTSLVGGAAVRGKDYNAVVCLPLSTVGFFCGSEDSTATAMMPPHSSPGSPPPHVAEVLCGPHSSNILALSSTTAQSCCAAHASILVVSVGGLATMTLWELRAHCPIWRAVDTVRDQSGASLGATDDNAAAATPTLNAERIPRFLSVCFVRALLPEPSTGVPPPSGEAERAADFVVVGGSDGVVRVFHVAADALSCCSSDRGGSAISHALVRDGSAPLSSAHPSPILCVSAVTRPSDMGGESAAPSAFASLVVAGDTNGMVFVVHVTGRRHPHEAPVIVLQQLFLCKASINALTLGMRRGPTEPASEAFHGVYVACALDSGDVAILHIGEVRETGSADRKRPAITLSVCGAPIKVAMTALRGLAWSARYPRGPAPFPLLYAASEGGLGLVVAADMAGQHGSETRRCADVRLTCEERVQLDVRGLSGMAIAVANGAECVCLVGQGVEWLSLPLA